MKGFQRKAVFTLAGKCFQPGSYDEQFIKDMVYRAENEVGYQLTDKQNGYLMRLLKAHRSSGEVHKQIQKEKSFSERLQGDQAKLIVSEGKLRIFREIMQEYADATSEWLIEDGGSRARLALELGEEET